MSNSFTVKVSATHLILIATSPSVSFGALLTGAADLGYNSTIHVAGRTKDHHRYIQVPRPAAPPTNPSLYAAQQAANVSFEAHCLTQRSIDRISPDEVHDEQDFAEAFDIAEPTRTRH